jgi:hypothetical protein
MARQITDKLVPVAEVPAGIYWLDRVKAKVIENWLGEPCVSEKDAARAMKVYEADRDAHEDRAARHQAYLRQREVDRACAGDEAVEAVRPKLIRQQVEQMNDGTFWLGDSVRIQAGTPGPRARGVMREVRREALEEFDRKYPEIRLEDFQ